LKAVGLRVKEKARVKWRCDAIWRVKEGGSAGMGRVSGEEKETGWKREDKRRTGGGRREAQRVSMHRGVQGRGASVRESFRREKESRSRGGGRKGVEEGKKSEVRQCGKLETRLGAFSYTSQSSCVLPLTLPHLPRRERLIGRWKERKVDAPLGGHAGGLKGCEGF
jgi:hypothetical protein